MNNIQKELLKRLVLQNGLKFSELTAGYDYENNVVYHLKQLLKNSYLSKREDKYYLTKEGIHLSGTYDLETLEEKKYKTVYLGLIIRFAENYVLRNRSATKGYVFHKLPGGKPFFAEKIPTALERIIQQNIGLKITNDRFQFDSTHFKTMRTPKGEPVFDDALFVYLLDLNAEEFAKTNLSAGNQWFTLAEIPVLKNLWPEVLHSVLREKWSPLIEYDYHTNYHIHEQDI